MNTYLYLTVFPEALVASMLPPEEYAPYLTSGSRKCFHGRTVFFEVNKDLLPPFFNRSVIESLCPHPDGSPKQSLTIAVYRVFEHVPMAAFGQMYLVTRDGKYIAIAPAQYSESQRQNLRLYQELCPLRPTVVSKLQPDVFRKSVTAQGLPVYVPRLLFADLLLGRLADPGSDIMPDVLPYADMDNIRFAIDILRRSKRDTLVVDRAHSHDFFYRTIGEGFFVGDEKELVYYPFPTREEREDQFHTWWRSAERS